MTINYLILAHHNYEHITRLIEALDDPGACFFVHVDRKTAKNYSYNAGNVFIMEDRVKVNWGGFSMVEAMLRLMRLALQTRPAGYFVLLSGADYPVCPNAEIHKRLSGNKEFIDMRPVPHTGKPDWRYRHWFFEYDRKTRNASWFLFRLTEAVMRLAGIRRKVPFKVFAGSQWWALTGECVQYILETIVSDSRYISFFKYCLIPDEAFFHTIIGNSPFLDKVANSLTFTHWTKKYSPLMINAEHLEVFKRLKEDPDAEPQVFARKFDKDNRHLLDVIDRELRC